MQPDVFGDLSQPSGVLAKLHEIASHDSLDEHQVGLARILRFRQNHSLINAALVFSGNIDRASEILIAEALNVLVSQDLPIHTRALAARILGHLICHYPVEAVSDFDIERVLESMIHVLSRSQSPMIKQALFRAISAARRSMDRRKVISPFCRISPNSSV
jgi:hypothetical protein